MDQEAIENSQYFGPAPVSLEAWQDRILRQRITNETISRAAWRRRSTAW